MKETAPELRISITCYHYENHGRQQIFTDARGNTTISNDVNTRKVETHRANDVFKYDTFIDNSAEFLVGKYDLTQVDFEKQITFANQKTQITIENQKALWIEKHKNRDTHFNTTESWELKGLSKNVLYYSNPEKKPFWFSLTFYFFANLFMLSWPYKMWLDSQCAFKKFIFKKEIFLEN